MSCIHYKFKSSLDYNSVTFDGLHLSLSDLKKAISHQKRLKPGEFDLEITNAQTGDVYKKGDELIAKNTSVIVSRVPVTRTTASSTQKSWEAFKQECAKVKEKERQMQLEKLKQSTDISVTSASEIDKIKAVIDQSTKGFEPSNFVGRTGVPNEHYICKRCNQKGHFVGNCPNVPPEDRVVEPRYKRTTGIPSTMLTIVDDPLHPGALLTTMGQFAVPTVDVLGYQEVKKEKPPFLPGDKQPEPEKKKIPQELLCHICEDLCVDAAIAPCCGTSFCDECLREELLESEDHQCPSCKETNVSPDRIVANRSMRMAVNNFLNDTGYTKVKRRRSSSHSGGDHQSLPAAKSPVMDGRPTVSIASVPTSASSSSQVPISSGLSIPSKLSYPSGRFSHSGPKHRHTYSERHYNKHQSPVYPNNSYAYAHAILNQLQKPWQFQQPANAMGLNTALNNRVTADVTPALAVSLGSSNDANKNNSNSVALTASWPVVPTAVAAATAVPRPSVPATQTNYQPLQTAPVAVGQTYSGFPQQGQQSGSYYPGVQAPSGPIKKSVDVFDLFADYTRRRSRTPERRRSRTRSVSPDWNKQKSWSPSPSRSKHKLSPRTSNVSPSKHTSHSYTPRRSPSPGGKHASSRSLSPRRLSDRRSRSRSLKRSRSRSFEPPRLSSKQRSRTRSPRSRSRQRSSTPLRHSSKLHSPRVRGSLSPLPRRLSASPLRQASDSPQPHKSLKSTVRKTSKSPLRRLTPPLHRSSLSPLRRSSRSPLRRSSKSPLRRLSKSPLRRSSKSPLRRSSKSPMRRSKSPFRRSSKSPLRRYSKSPLRRSSKSPLRRYSKSPLRRSSKSPIKRSSKSPLRRLSMSPLRRSSKTPTRRSSKSPLRRYSKSPPPKYSKSPVRRSSISPRRHSSKSPLPPYRDGSRSRSYRRTSRSRSKSYTRHPRSYSRPRSPRPYSSLSPRRSPINSKNHSPLQSPHRNRSKSPYRRSSRSRTPSRKSPLPIYRSRSRSISRHKYSPKYRSRSPVPKIRRSLTPLSPARSKSPYKRPLTPPRRSPSPRRDRGGYGGRGRGMGRGGYRNFSSGRDKFPRSPPRDGMQPHSQPPSEFGGIAGNLPPVPYFPTMGLPPPEEYFRNDPAGYQEFVRSLYSQAWAQSQAFPGAPASSPDTNSNFPAPPGSAVGGNSFHPAPAPYGAYRPPPINPEQAQHRPPWEHPGPAFNTSHPHTGIDVMLPRDRKDQPPRDLPGGRPWERDRMARDRDRYERERDKFRRSDRGRGHFDRSRDHDKPRDGDRSREYDKGKVEKGREGDLSRSADKIKDSERGRGHERGRDIERHHRDGDRRDRIKEHDRSKGRGSSRNDKDKSKSSDKSREKISNEKKKSPSRKGKDEDKAKSKKKPEKKREESKKVKAIPEAQSKGENDKDSSLQKTSSVSDKDSGMQGVESNQAELKTEPQAEPKPIKKAGNQNNESKADAATAKTSTGNVGSSEKQEVKEKKTGAKKKGDALGTKKKKDALSEAGTAGGTEKKVKKIKKKKLTFGASEVDSKQGLKKKKLKRVVDYKSETMSEDGEDKAPLGRSPLKKSRLTQQTNEEVSSKANEEDMQVVNASDSVHVSSSETHSEGIKLQPVSQEKLDQKKESAGANEEKDRQNMSEIKTEQVEKADTTKGKGDEPLPELPQLSKWERDDFDLYEAVDQPTKDVTPKKLMLPRSVVDKAEKFLTQKPMKNAVMVAHVTTSTKSPETSPEKPEKAALEKSADRQRSDSHSPKLSGRRVYVENRRDSKDKKPGDLQITVKNSVSRHKGDSNDRKRSEVDDRKRNEVDDRKRYEVDNKKRISSRGDDHRASHHHQHHPSSNRESFEEDQRSVVRSHSLERELKEQKSKSQKTLAQEKPSKKDSKWKPSFGSATDEKTSKDGKDVSKKDYPREKHRGGSSSPGHKRVSTSRHRDSTDQEHQASSNNGNSKTSSKDLRHRLDEKNKAKSAVDQRKLSVMDEAEFVPDYEDLVPHGASDAEQGDASSSHNSPGSSSNEKDSKKRKRNENEEDTGKAKPDGEDESDKGDNEDENGKHKKSKKKHKHKEKNKEKKEKHKHKKKKHKHKKSKEREAQE
ncbi:hypothetical protein RRG08_063684 [Elysia crispata]|uniref:E3 ubiquitin-protein ligase RBBP6 n=1 Tax=Elysia crispata TaxID=231223 RepID=A0AAE1DCR2_9GAST|nr:hypothetical protein RRG08_063684 [Elysia crispata]